MVADVIILWRRRCTWLATVLHRFNSIFMAPPLSANVLRPAHRNAILCPFTAEIVAHFADDWINFPATKTPDLIAIFGELLARCNCCECVCGCFDSDWNSILNENICAYIIPTIDDRQKPRRFPSFAVAPFFFVAVSFYDFQWITSLTDNHRLLFLSTVKVEGNDRPRRSSYLFTSACNHRHQPRRWIAKG